MEKIFAVFANVSIVKKPSFLDDFRTRFDKPYEPHVTLKQPTYCSVSSQEKIKEIFTITMNKQPMQSIDLLFTELNIGTNAADGLSTIMVNAVYNDRLMRLQREIRDAYLSFNMFVENETRTYEENFAPHVNIGRSLDAGAVEEARTLLPENIEIHGVIDTVTLALVDEISPIASRDPKSLTVFSLQENVLDSTI